MGVWGKGGGGGVAVLVLYLHHVSTLTVLLVELILDYWLCWSGTDFQHPYMLPCVVLSLSQCIYLP